MDKGKAIRIIERQLQIINNLKSNDSEFKQWKLDTETAIKNIFGKESEQLQSFKAITYKYRERYIKKIPNNNFTTDIYGYSSSPYRETTATRTVEDLESGLENAKILLQSLIKEIKEYWNESIDNNDSLDKLNNIEKIELICNQFHQVARQMRSRYDDRPTLEVNDEYDVQDLFHSLLILYFDDIRREESNPSYAGSNSRSDFLLKPEKTIIEIKKTRRGLNDKKLGEELSLDIQKYQSHPDCQTLVCFVYDPEVRINNSRGLERDLEQVTEKIDVKVFIRPQ
ncbi:MAG: hypothetical protein AAF298_04770 [Cyanobacteria bacterium P01_A01_bin.40]